MVIWINGQDSRSTSAAPQHRRRLKQRDGASHPNRQVDPKTKQRHALILLLTASFANHGADLGRNIAQGNGSLDFVSALSARPRNCEFLAYGRCEAVLAVPSRQGDRVVSSSLCDQIFITVHANPVLEVSPR